MPAAARQLDALRTELESHGIACTTRPKASLVSAGENLLRYACEQAVDLIVVGIKKRSKVGKLLFGSTAQYVILEADCPVLTVK